MTETVERISENVAGPRPQKYLEVSTAIKKRENGVLAANSLNCDVISIAMLNNRKARL